MATEINEPEDLTLRDETKVTIKPLNIKLLRRFMNQVQKLQELENDADAIDVLYVASAIALQGSDRPELGDIFVKNDAGKDTTEVDPEKSEELEELLDLPIMEHINRVAGGLQSDPNQMTRGLPGTT